MLNGDYNIRYTLYDADQNTDVAEVTYHIDREAPQTPENLKAVSKDGTVQLSWEASKSADCTYYKLYRKDAEAEDYTLLAKLTDRYQTTYSDSQVEEGKIYIYALLAGDAFINESDMTPPVIIEVDEDLAAPQVENITPKAGRISQVTKINVTATDNRSVAKIRLQYKEEQAEEWIDLAEAEAANNAVSYAWDTTALSDGAYTLRAIAIDASGNESAEEFTRRYVIDNTGIGQIEITKHTVSATGVSIHWADVTENDFGYFQVEQLTGDSFVSVGTTSTVLGYQVSGLVPNTTYTFRVVGYDNLGNRGIPSEELTITTAEDTTAPVITAVYPVASYYRDKLALQVKAQDDYAISKAVFSYSLDKESFEEIATVAAGTISGTTAISTDFDISKLPEGRLYVKFQVYDAAGNKNAPLSTGEDVIVEYIIDRTAPGKVEGVKAVDTCGYVELNWNSEEMQDIKAYKIKERAMLIRDGL